MVELRCVRCCCLWLGCRQAGWWWCVFVTFLSHLAPTAVVVMVSPLGALTGCLFTSSQADARYETPVYQAGITH